MHSIQLTGELTEVEPKGIDRELITRLIFFYQHQPKPSLSEIWNGVISQYHSELHNALIDRNVELVYERLSHLSNGMFSFGMEVGNEADKSFMERRWSFSLEALGNATGVLPVFNPEQENQIAITDLELIQKIESVIGHRISYDGDGGLFGYRIGERFINCNTLIGELVAWLCRPNGKCLEIGAGFGMAAIASMKRHGISEYHISDLPTVAVIQAYFSATSGIPIRLSGEQLLNGTRLQLHGLSEFECDLDWALNQDSMPEMTEESAIGYVEKLCRCLKGQFHSINHESSMAGQKSVASIVGMKMDRKYRVPFWGRPGYVHEVFEPII